MGVRPLTAPQWVSTDWLLKQSVEKGTWLSRSVQRAWAAVFRAEPEAACQAENFYLSEEGYVFWISGGTLPSANSPIEVTLPYDDMKDVSVDG